MPKVTITVQKSAIIFLNRQVSKDFLVKNSATPAMNASALRGKSRFSLLKNIDFLLNANPFNVSFRFIGFHAVVQKSVAYGICYSCLSNILYIIISLQAGYVTEEDVRLCSMPEKNVIDLIIDAGPQTGMVDIKRILEG